MLIYSKNRYVPTDVNMMVIRGVEDDGYFYIHRYLYDQARAIQTLVKMLSTSSRISRVLSTYLDRSCFW